MKKLIAAMMIATAVQTMAVDLTLSPIYTVVDVVRSAIGTVVGVVASPFASTAGSLQQKEQLEAVRTDAVNFLAGEEASEVLTQSISQVKANAEFSDLSDAQVAGLIVTALK